MREDPSLWQGSAHLERNYGDVSDCIDPWQLCGERVAIHRNPAGLVGEPRIAHRDRRVVRGYIEKQIEFSRRAIGEVDASRTWIN